MIGKLGVCGALLTCVAVIASVGCDNNPSLAKLKEINKTNVAKVKTCFVIFDSRKGKSPESKEELLEFLRGGSVDRNLERIDITQENLEEIFVSERDGKPLKIRWGLKMNPERLMPIAFEEEGIDGVRLVAADVVVEVDNDEEYEKMWNGEYVSENEKLRRSQSEEME